MRVWRKPWVYAFLEEFQKYSITLEKWWKFLKNTNITSYKLWTFYSFIFPHELFTFIKLLSCCRLILLKQDGLLSSWFWMLEFWEHCVTRVVSFQATDELLSVCSHHLLCTCLNPQILFRKRGSGDGYIELVSNQGLYLLLIISITTVSKYSHILVPKLNILISSKKYRQLRRFRTYLPTHVGNNSMLMTLDALLESPGSDSNTHAELKTISNSISSGYCPLLTLHD